MSTREEKLLYIVLLSFFPFFSSLSSSSLLSSLRIILLEFERKTTGHMEMQTLALLGRKGRQREEKVLHLHLGREASKNNCF